MWTVHQRTVIVYLHRWLSTFLLFQYTHAASSHQKGELIPPSLKSWLALCSALKNRMQWKLCCVVSGLEPNRLRNFLLSWVTMCGNLGYLSREAKKRKKALFDKQTEHIKHKRGASTKAPTKAILDLLAPFEPLQSTSWGPQWGVPYPNSWPKNCEQ